MSTPKPYVLVIVDWYLPGFRAGGPIRSVANLIHHLHSSFRFDVITSDTDYQSETPYPNLTPNNWIERDDCRVMYLNRDGNILSRWRKLFAEHPADVVYINSAFAPEWALAPLLVLKLFYRKRKIVLAPRGMLGEGSMNIKSGKKRLFLQLAKAFGLYRNITWHASSAIEEQDIRTVFPSAQVQIAGNLSGVRLVEGVNRSKGAATRFVCVARVNPIKNLLGAVQAFEALQTTGEKPVFHAYGPADDPEYLQQVKELAARLADQVDFEYKGAVAHDQVEGLFDAYDFLLMPTFHENFGHTIAEALGRGCPVLISDKTPWKNLQEAGAGWDVSLDDPKPLAEAVQAAVNLSSDSYAQMAEKAVSLAADRVNDPQVLAANKKLFTLRP